MNKILPFILMLSALAIAGCGGGGTQIVEVPVEVPIEVTRIVEVPIEVTRIVEVPVEVIRFVEAEAGLLRLTFDGESCTYEGPTALTAGPVALVFLNESEGYAAVNLVRHLGDHTIQDMIDYIGEEPTSKHHPAWSLEVGTWYPIRAGESRLWEGDLEQGIHAMVCARVSPLGVWFGTGLTVED